MQLIVKCDYCGKPAQLVTGKKIYPHRKDLSELKFWECEPCRAYVGCHRNSKDIPLGRLANEELRKAKKKAHSYFDPTWREGDRSRKDAYTWLAHKLGIPRQECHIGMFDLEQCKQVVVACNEFYKQQIEEMNNESHS